MTQNEKRIVPFTLFYNDTLLRIQPRETTAAACGIEPMAAALLVAALKFDLCRPYPLAGHSVQSEQPAVQP